MNARNRVVVAHLARAVARYIPEAERDARTAGYQVPVELHLIADFLLDCASTRQSATEDAGPADTVDSGVMSEQPVMTKREVAASLRTSVRSVERLIESGALVAVKVGAATRVRRVDMEAYVAGLTSPPSFRDSVVEKATHA